MAALALTSGVSACGGGERQDVTEPSGNFPVRVAKAKFPSRQSLPETSDLQLAIKNVGDQTIPDLAVTIFTPGRRQRGSSGEAGVRPPARQGSFNVRLDDPNLAEPEPAGVDSGEQVPEADHAPSVTVKDSPRPRRAGAAAAQTDTFQFGAVRPARQRTSFGG